MAKRKLEEWITSAEAARIISENSGHQVTDGYVRLLAGRGRIATKQIDARTKLYNRTHAEAIEVSTKRGPKPTKQKETAS